MTKKISESLFSAILYLFSSAMLILSLLMSIKLTAVSDSAGKVRTEINTLEEENALLRAEYESLVSLEKISEYAENAGMVKCSIENIEYLTISQMGD